MNPLINTNITMLIALASLFLVLLFLTILHCYAKWFLDRNTRSPPSIVVVPAVVLGARGLHNLHTLLTIDRTSEQDDESPPMTKGLDSSAISSMPQFVFGESSTSDEECVICLGLFEDGQKGKRLAFCEHAFHVECIDMWLHSNTTCPVCRAPAVRLDDVRSDDVTVVDHENIDVNDEQNYDGSLEMNQSLGETSLEIVVEVPKEENNGTNDACEIKSIYLSDIVN